MVLLVHLSPFKWICSLEVTAFCRLGSTLLSQRGAWSFSSMTPVSLVVWTHFVDIFKFPYTPFLAKEPIFLISLLSHCRAKSSERYPKHSLDTMLSWNFLCQTSESITFDFSLTQDFRMQKVVIIFAMLCNSWPLSQFLVESCCIFESSWYRASAAHIPHCL